MGCYGRDIHTETSIIEPRSLSFCGLEAFSLIVLSSIVGVLSALLVFRPSRPNVRVCVSDGVFLSTEICMYLRERLEILCIAWPSRLASWVFLPAAAMPPKKRASGKHKPGSRTRANGYTGKSGWNKETAAEVLWTHKQGMRHRDPINITPKESLQIYCGVGTAEVHRAQ